MAYDDGYFSTVQFPIVRRVFSPLKANSIVSVQPMSVPSGGIFYLDGYYGSNDFWLEGEIQREIEEAINISETFMKLIRKYNGKILNKVVDESFPQYRETLQKLLILK